MKQLNNPYFYSPILNDSMYDLIVVGAGAAGLMAAGRAAGLGAKVLLVEKNDRPGRKILITGKGRCNITNNAPYKDFVSQIYPNGRFLKHAFGQFFHQDMITLLSKHGTMTVLERGGRYFPASDKSADVLEALLRWLHAGQVDCWFGCRAKEIILQNGMVQGAIIQTPSGIKEVQSKCMVVATGGKSYPATGSTGDGYHLASMAGHSIVSVRPSLVPLETAGDLAQQMQGLSLKNVRASVWINGKKNADAFGEMLFTHFGLSGPIILSLSRLVVDGLSAHADVEIVVDLKPALDEQQLDKRLLRDINDHGKKHMSNLFKMWLPAAMIPVFIDQNGMDHDLEAHQLSAAARKKIALMMKNLRFRVTGHRSFKEAIITAGGVSTSEIHSKTMESKLVKKLFFAGEVMDLDANTGGYNLQIAWSTGWLAGQCAATYARSQHNNAP